MADDIVTRSQQHGTYHDNTGTDEEYIQHLELKLDKAADEIERLQQATEKVDELKRRVEDLEYRLKLIEIDMSPDYD